MLDESPPNANSLNHFVFFNVLSQFGDAAQVAIIIHKNV
jgi:hypothetical protein